MNINYNTEFSNFEENDEITKKYELFNIKLLNNRNYNKTDINSVKIGDIIRVEFIPYSQIEIDAIYGKIIYIDAKNEDIVVYCDTIDNENNMARHVKSILIGNLSYYGDSRGFEYIIEKLEE